MDWTPTEMQTAIKGLAAQILQDDPTNWDALVDADLLGVEDLLDQVTLLIEVGKTGARVPVLETLMLAWPLSRDGAEGVLTGALLEEGSRDLARPTTQVSDGRLHGSKVCVPAVDRASRLVLTAGDGIYVVDRTEITVEPQVGTNDDPLGRVVLDGCPGERLAGLDLVPAWRQRVDLGIAAVQYGLAKTAVRLTAAYVRERKQFGRAIGTFQAVSQRAADAWIDLQALEVVLLQAAWRVQEGLEAERQVRIARWWAAEATHRIVAAAQHLHGGFGFDRDYPLHRYFLTAKQLEFVLGGANAQLHALGELVARDGGIGAAPVAQQVGGQA
jgi:alkylation response protein AidB-like acyl-CoA dehydrogenase